jgi:hypothetical protein
MISRQGSHPKSFSTSTIAFAHRGYVISRLLKRERLFSSTGVTRYREALSLSGIINAQTLLESDDLEIGSVRLRLTYSIAS